jgi:malate/lactate dehydrogenase
MKRRPDDLETRVTNRKRQLITEIIEHKKNSSRYGAAEAIDKINHHLSELSQILKAAAWTDLSAGARLRLAEWVAR